MSDLVQRLRDPESLLAELMARLGTDDPLFDAFREAMPDKYWARYDLSAVRLGYEFARHALIAAPQPEALTRFCPGCGSVGPVPEKYRDCCPDGDKARMIPEALARHCRDLFQLALSAPGDALHPQQPAAQPASAEPVAEVTGEWHSKHIAWLPGSPDLPLGAKLYTLPRDPAEVMRLAEDAQRWRFWRQHWQLLTRMEVARPAGIDLSRRGVYSPDEMDEVTDAALARAVGAAE